LVFYKETISKCSKEEYVNCCSRKQKAGIAWRGVRIWKLREIRRGIEKGICPPPYVMK
jgi:hypothetical protein